MQTMICERSNDKIALANGGLLSIFALAVGLGC